jgi:hypothetical protein
MHIHHLVWGILILLLVGYGWLLDLGRSHSPLSIFFSRLMSVSYGVGAALTLDEFALWLNLEPDAYWSAPDGSASTRSFFSAACWRSAPGARRSSAASISCGASAPRSARLDFRLFAA